MILIVRTKILKSKKFYFYFICNLHKSEFYNFLRDSSSLIFWKLTITNESLNAHVSFPCRCCSTTNSFHLVEYWSGSWSPNIIWRLRCLNRNLYEIKCAAAEGAQISETCFVFLLLFFTCSFSHPKSHNNFIFFSFATHIPNISFCRKCVYCHKLSKQNHL